MIWLVEPPTGNISCLFSGKWWFSPFDFRDIVLHFWIFVAEQDSGSSKNWRCLVYLGLIWYLKLVYPIPVWGYDENQFLRIAILRFCHGNFCWTTPCGGSVIFFVAALFCTLSNFGFRRYFAWNRTSLWRAGRKRNLAKMVTRITGWKPFLVSDGTLLSHLGVPCGRSDTTTGMNYYMICYLVWSLQHNA
jgi:hypothetical protein